MKNEKYHTVEPVPKFNENEDKDKLSYWNTITYN